MHLESMYKTIKYYYLNGYNVGRLDKSIMVPSRFTRDNKVEILVIVKLTKGKSSSRLQEIKKMHNRCEFCNVSLSRINYSERSVESEITKNSF